MGAGCREGEMAWAQAVRGVRWHGRMLGIVLLLAFLG